MSDLTKAQLQERVDQLMRECGDLAENLQQTRRALEGEMKLTERMEGKGEALAWVITGLLDRLHGMKPRHGDENDA
jgi:hypothetical protein